MRSFRSEEAIASFRKAIETDSNNPEANANLGNCLMRLGRIDEAIPFYEKAIALRPTYAKAHNNLGSVLLRKGHAAAALPHFEKAAQLQPQNPGPLNSLAWVLATAPDATLRNGANALKLALRASQLAEDRNPELLRTLAAAYAESNRFPEALEIVGKAARIAESDPSLIRALREQEQDYRKNIPTRDNSLVTSGRDGPPGRP